MEFRSGTLCKSVRNHHSEVGKLLRPTVSRTLAGFVTLLLGSGLGCGGLAVATINPAPRSALGACD